MKHLILFDIDGTILSTNGAARRAFHSALLEVYRTAGPIDDHPFDGKTDPQIARELLLYAGLQDADIDARLDRLWEAYLRNLETELNAPGHASLLYPGVRELIDALLARSDVALLALLTGNIARGAALKLASVSLADRFAFGAFGSDSERREELPAVAVQRARERAGVDFRGRSVIVIGDTPSDVTCGRALGVRAVAVATGRHDADTLLRAGAERVFADFADTETVLDHLLNGAA